MSLDADIKQAIADNATAFETFKTTNDARLKALESGDSVTAEDLDSKLKKINADITKYSAKARDLKIEQEADRDRLEELEARAGQPGATAIEKADKAYAKAFDSAIRDQFQDPAQAGELKRLEVAVNEAKDITTVTGPAGGFGVPEEISRDIEKLERKLSPVRDLIKVVQVGTSDYKELVNLSGSTGGWVGETGTRSATLTPILREVTPTHGELYAYPQVSEWSLDDIFFSVEGWLTEDIAETFAIEEGQAVISGDGTTKPTGMLDTAPVATVDGASPLRAAEAYQFIGSTNSPAGVILPDALIDLVYAVNSRYRAMATWAFNSTTAGLIRKLKDGNNQYLWAPGLQPGEPAALLGYPTATWEDMPDAAADAHPVGFGNWRRAYVLTDRVGMRITRDNITNPGFVRFYVRRREGGMPLNNDAVKVLKTN